MMLSGLGYQCASGETFDQVALKLYGDEKYASDLLNANPALCGRVVFDGGEILTLPVVETPVSSPIGRPLRPNRRGMI